MRCVLLVYLVRSFYKESKSLFIVIQSRFWWFLFPLTTRYERRRKTKFWCKPSFVGEEEGDAHRPWEGGVELGYIGWSLSRCGLWRG